MPRSFEQLLDPIHSEFDNWLGPHHTRLSLTHLIDLTEKFKIQTNFAPNLLVVGKQELKALMFATNGMVSHKDKFINWRVCGMNVIPVIQSDTGILLAHFRSAAQLCAS